MLIFVRGATRDDGRCTSRKKQQRQQWRWRQQHLPLPLPYPDLYRQRQLPPPQNKAASAAEPLTDKMKRSFFQAAVVSIVLYGCTTWTLTKRLEKKLDGNYTRMLSAILNKSWRQHPTRHQLYGHLPPITQTIQVRRTRHADTAGEARASS